MVDSTDFNTLMAKEVIKDALARYCRGVDRLCSETLRAVYWPDAWDDHGPFSGKRDAFIAWVIPYLKDKFETSTHVVSNHIIEIEKDVAFSECCFSAVYAYSKDGADYTRMSYGRYIDKFERRGGEWRIIRRTVVNDWARNDLRAMPVELKAPGKRNKQDPVFQLREDYMGASFPSGVK